MAGLGSRARASKKGRGSERAWRGRSFERLEDRAYLAAVSVTGPVEVNEAAKTAQFVVRLSEAATSPVTVNYALQASPTAATYSRDFRLFVGQAQLKPTGSITFQPGQTSQVITMNVVDDNLREGDERVTFVLHAVRDGSLDPRARMLSMTIKDNDSYTAVVVGPKTVQAGSTVDYRLQLSSPATRRETFYVTTRRGSDQVPSGDPSLSRVPVTILPGHSIAFFPLETTAISTQGYEEVILIDVAPATSGFPPLPPFAVTITKPHVPRPPDVVITDGTVTEGGPGTSKTLNFTITLSEPSNQPLSIAYATADGTARAAANDYQPTSGTVTFAAGEKSRIVSVTILGDDTVEADETFSLLLSSSTNALVARATATITNDDSPRGPAFQISIVFPDNTLTSSEKSVFLDAAARWSAIIVADLPDQAYRGRIIDDIEIAVTSGSIDGPYGTVAEAAPEAFRSGSLIPYLGRMEIDSADVARMVNDRSFASVITHEMGHVLGIGTLWEIKNLVTGIGTSNPGYVGVNAVREYQSLSGTTATSVPLENTGGPGTTGGHWRESVFGTELMTGYVEPSGVSMPLSRVTIGSLQDIGYSVNYAAADPYSLGLRRARLASAPTHPSSTHASRARLLVGDGAVVANLFAAVASGIPGTASHGPVGSKTFRSIGT